MKKLLVLFIVWAFLLTIVVLALSGPVMWLWGAGPVSAFGAPDMTYWQTVSLVGLGVLATFVARAEISVG